MPLPAEIWSWGPWVGLLFVFVLLGIPILRDRIKRQDEADQERRERAEQADQERREKADEERRAQATMLIQYLQGVATNAQARLDLQTGEFLKALEQRDRQSAEQTKEITSALRGLTTAIDSLQRRRQP